MNEAKRETHSKFRRFLNRELSWMAFNARVLEEAHDLGYPLLERLKFVAIVSSNLDEFFAIRVAGLERKLKRNPNARDDDGLPASEVLLQIREWALAQKSQQGLVLRDLLEKVKEQGLYLQTQVAPSDAGLIEFAKTLTSELKIQSFKKLENLGSMAGGRIYVFVRCLDNFHVVSWSENFDRLVRLGPELRQYEHHYVLAEKLIAAATHHYFPGESIIETFPFKIIRDADLSIDPNTDPEELLSTVEEAIQGRGRQAIVRLEIDAPQISDGALALAAALKLKTRSIYRYDAPLDLKILWRLHGLEDFARLRFPEPIEPKKEDGIPGLQQVLSGHDFLLHHPYDSFETVVALLKVAARDKDVTTIRQTLYRTGISSPVVEALKEGARNGKRVTVAIELRARFDEAHNIHLARELKKNGVRVLQGYPDKKVHCKLTQVLRRTPEGLQSIVHIGTGNYNPNTARIYTDLGLLTVNKSFGRDAEKIFKAIEKGRVPRTFESFVAAPVELHKKLLGWIRNETRRAREGDKDARIVAKINALADIKLAEALYEASEAGVTINLIVRGACILRPGVPGLSDRIRVISIVDRYLEHSRIYYFRNGDNPLVYLSSADWMPRNLYNRVEIAFPVYDPDIKRYISDIVLETYLKDNQKARQLMPDGTWVRVEPGPLEPPRRAQDVFEKLAANHYEKTSLFSRFILQPERTP